MFIINKYINPINKASIGTGSQTVGRDPFMSQGPISMAQDSSKNPISFPIFKDVWIFISKLLIKRRNKRVVKTADLQACNAVQSEALCACRSGVDGDMAHYRK